MSLLPYKITAIKDFDATGQNVLAGASVSILNRSGGYASLYTDDTGATPIGNPFNVDSNGEKEVWLTGGEYQAIVAGGQTWDFNLSGASDIQYVETYADLATTPAPTPGMIVYLKQHTSGGLGGGYFQDTAGSITNDGGTIINNTVTAGRHWKRINYSIITDDFFGDTSAPSIKLKTDLYSENLLFNSGSDNINGAIVGAHDGDSNTAFGFFALRDVTSGYASTAVGRAALVNMTTGQGNTGLGYQSLLKLTTGENNVAVGTDCGLNTTTGSNNTFVGHHVFFLGAGTTNFTGSDNVVVSENTGRNATTAYDNVIIGRLAQYQIVDSYRSVTIGKAAAFTPTSLIDSVIIGTSCNETSTTTNYCVNIGARNNINTQTDTYSVNVGRDCFYTDAGSNKTNGYNTAFGTEAGFYVWGQRNIFFGNRAGAQSSLTEINGAVCIGYRAGDGWATSNDLIIANNELSTNPLINGNFSTRVLKLEGQKLNIRNLPTSASGLSTGDIWNDAGTLKVV